MEESLIMTQIETKVQPKGNILNDNDSGVDHLGHTVYAEALAEKIDHVSTPITIGVFARWGSGKSFLLKHVRNLLERRQKQAEIEEYPPTHRCKYWPMRCLFRFFLFLTIAGIIIIASLWAVSPHMFVSSSRFENDVSTQNQALFNITDQPKILAAAHFWFDFSRVFALAILLLCLVLVCIVVCGNNDWWSSQFFANFRLISYVAFTKLPIKSPESSVMRQPSDDEVTLKMEVENLPEKRSSTRYIFVNFNAWEFAGSDSLWAGIVTNLSNAIEEEFGSVASRIFRMLQVDAISRDVITNDINSTHTTLFVNFPNCSSNISNVKDLMMEFGIVRYCKKFDDWKNSNLKKKTKIKSSSFMRWWVVSYSSSREAHHAHQVLDLKGLEVSFNDPSAADGTNPNTSNKHNIYDKKKEDKNDEEISIGSDMPLTSSRMTSYDACKDQYGNTRHKIFHHVMKHPKTTCNFPNLFWWFLIGFAIITLPVITYSLAEVLNLDVFRTGRAVPLIVQAVSWMPAVGAVSFVMLNFVWAMLHSQRSRIHSALDGTKGNMAAQLGFMATVKTEVKCITKLLKCAEFSHNKKYKIIISIDDLDRVALEKIKSVLEAVSILLSDPSSPFVCLIAVDSRIAVKSIEETMGPTLVKNHVNGHEYLKKIINLPFCLPEVNHKIKKQYIAGLIASSDKTKTKKTEIKTDMKDVADGNLMNSHQTQATKYLEKSHILNGTSESVHNDVPKSKMTDGSMMEVDGMAPTRGITRNNINQDSLTRVKRSSSDVSSTELTSSKVFSDVISNKQFTFECRKFLHGDHMVQRHLEGNPRNIKRIFNVISLTSWILYCYEKQRRSRDFLQRNAREDIIALGKTQCFGTEVMTTKSFAHDLVLWVVLTDQWPYRMSYLLQVIEDADRNHKAKKLNKCIEDATPLFDIYVNIVLPELKAIGPEKEEDGSLLSLDFNPEILKHFLQELKCDTNIFSKGKVKLLREITINLDHSLRQTIVYQREIAANIITNGPKSENNSTVDHSQDTECHDLEKPEQSDCHPDLPFHSEELNVEVPKRSAEATRLSATPASQILFPATNSS